MILSSYKQTQLVIWTNQILFVVSIFCFYEHWMIPWIFISMYLFGFMSESSLHRYYTHRSYETTDNKEKLLRIFAFLTGQGPILSWVTVHRTHHAFEDTDRDSHSPYHLSWWKIYLALLPSNYKNNLILDLIRLKGKNYYVFENKYYFYLWILLWVSSYLIYFEIFFVIVSGSAIWYIGTCLVNIIAHTRGKKNFHEAVAYNNMLVNMLTGVGHHNNHHKFPRNYTYSVDKEIDIYAFGIRKIFMLSEANPDLKT